MAAKPAYFEDIWSADRDRQNAAYAAAMAEAEHPVGWAYAVWDAVVAQLASPDNHNRAIAAQLLARLAASDPEGRMLRDFPALFAVTRDDRFVTARHALQSLWRVGLAGEAQRRMLLAALEARFAECTDHKNWSLIRFDIVSVLRRLFDAGGGEETRALALRLIEAEADAKYRKKYAAVWR